MTTYLRERDEGEKEKLKAKLTTEGGNGCKTGGKGATTAAAKAEGWGMRE